MLNFYVYLVFDWIVIHRHDQFFFDPFFFFNFFRRSYPKDDDFFSRRLAAERRDGHANDLRVSDPLFTVSRESKGFRGEGEGGAIGEPGSCKGTRVVLLVGRRVHQKGDWGYRTSLIFDRDAMFRPLRSDALTALFLFEYAKWWAYCIEKIDRLTLLIYVLSSSGLKIYHFVRTGSIRADVTRLHSLRTIRLVVKFSSLLLRLRRSSGELVCPSAICLSSYLDRNVGARCKKDFY